tara:strand:+ start:76404 stop:77249 length:846 start_codon:yes stop_codon:yes gene_type:complete
VIDVISGGMYTSIQDMGRYGYRRLGVPLSGTMDRYSARLANRLVGNEKEAAVIEITHVGPVLKFNIATEIAITGAGFSPTIHDTEVPLNTRLFVKEHSLLKFGLPNYGLRAYLSVAGGFLSEKIMGSYSQYPGITSSDTLEKGDSLDVSVFDRATSVATASVKVDKDHFHSEEIEVTKGPEFSNLTKAFQKKIIGKELKVSTESNRMAYLLSGLNNVSAKEIITSPVQPGTVQLTPSGQCIVLMRDSQTTGGYSRILQLTESAINKLAQKQAGKTVRFVLV